MKKFNIATSCVPGMHYMVDISGKIEKIKKIIDAGEYFTVNRARQYGKTTLRYELENTLSPEYIILNISFESIGDDTFKSEEKFSSEIFNIFADSVRFTDSEFEKELRKYGEGIKTLKELSNRVTDFCVSKNKKIILMIDEVDKSSNNQLFLSFLGIFRDKYIARNVGKDATFWSIILFSVHDVKNLKLKLNSNEEEKYNSPWNVAVDFKVDMSFDPKEISTMLIEYEKDYKTGMNIKEISQKIYNYTNGYPFLVSKLAKIIDEEVNKEFNEDGIKEAIKILLDESNTLFDDLIKNLENDNKLYKLVEQLIIDGEIIGYNVDEPTINKALMYGILSKDKNRKLKINNKIFELRIYDYMLAKRRVNRETKLNYETNSQFINKDGDLEIIKVLDKFQELMYEEYREEDGEFIEKQGRLIFLAFIRPIINGAGFYYVETETRTNKRMDIVITYNKKQYIIELKKWYGKKQEEKGHNQLKEYMEIYNIDEAYMVFFDFRKNKEYKKEWINIEDRRIYEVTV